MLPIASSNKQELDVAANPLTEGQEPAVFDGPIRVTKQDGDATFTQDPATPNVVTFKSSDAPGTSHFLLEADVREGAEEKFIQEVVEYVVTAEEAASFGLTVGAPRPKTP